MKCVSIVIAFVTVVLSLQVVKAKEPLRLNDRIWGAEVESDYLDNPDHISSYKRNPEEYLRERAADTLKTLIKSQETRKFVKKSAGGTIAAAQFLQGDYITKEMSLNKDWSFAAEVNKDLNYSLGLRLSREKWEDDSKAWTFKARGDNGNTQLLFGYQKRF